MMNDQGGVMEGEMAPLPRLGKSEKEEVKYFNVRTLLRSKVGGMFKWKLDGVSTCLQKREKGG